MTRFRLFLLVFVALDALLCLIFLPDWGEDPTQLALGSWRSQHKSLGIHADVSEGRINWNGKAGRGVITYTWLQTEEEPYRLQFKRGQDTMEAQVTFDGADTAILEPDILGKLPPAARDYIRKQNRINKRPEDEFRLIFVRVKEERK